MKIISLKHRQEQGAILLTVIVIGAIMCVAIFATLDLSSNSVKNAHGRVDWNKAYYTTENAVVWATQQTLDQVAANTPPASGSSNYYSTVGGSIPLAQLVGGTNGDPDFRNAWVSVQQPTTWAPNTYIVTASSKVNDKVRTLQATITAFPVSQGVRLRVFFEQLGLVVGIAHLRPRGPALQLEV